MEIIARQVSLLSFRNAQENYSRSASSTSIFHLFYIENHRNYFFFFFFRESRFFSSHIYSFLYFPPCYTEKTILVSRCWYVLDGVYHRVFYKKTLVTRHRRDFGRDFHTAVNTLLWGTDSLFPSEKPREIESSTGFHSCLSISSIFCHAACAT